MGGQAYDIAVPARTWGEAPTTCCVNNAASHGQQIRESLSRLGAGSTVLMTLEVEADDLNRFVEAVVYSLILLVTLGILLGAILFREPPRR